jgi:predicted cation transporter
MVFILIGSYRLYGIDLGLIISGGVLIVMNIITLIIAFRLRDR